MAELTMQTGRLPNPRLFDNTLKECQFNYISNPQFLHSSQPHCRRLIIRSSRNSKHASTDKEKLRNNFGFTMDAQKAKERKEALESAMSEINSTFGKGSVIRIGSEPNTHIETFPSGCLSLDLVLGGGLPRGRIIELFGPESSGKTTLALHAIAEVQKAGGEAMLIDAEHAFDVTYAQRLGVNCDDLWVCQPDSGEMALETVDRVLRSRAVDLVCIDSVSALTPRAEIEGEIGDQQIGLQARLMSQSLRKLAANASKSNCTLLFLNQLRMKIGTFFGNPETTSGGVALKFFSSLRLDIRSLQRIKEKSQMKEEDVGIRTRVKVVKSKVSLPYKQAEFDIIFGLGISQTGCIVDCAEYLGFISRKGSWYSYGETKLGQGRDKAIQFLKENPQLSAELELLIRNGGHSTKPLEKPFDNISDDDDDDNDAEESKLERMEE